MSLQFSSDICEACVSAVADPGFGGGGGKHRGNMPLPRNINKRANFRSTI